MLLDTHAFLWWLDGDRQLPARARRTIADAANTVLVSAASAWEITTKVRIGKLPGAVEVAADVAGCITRQRFESLDITFYTRNEPAAFQERTAIHLTACLPHRRKSKTFLSSRTIWFSMSTA